MQSILVAEDHAIVREPLARLLRLEGYRTLCAANGAEAIAMLAQESVDLVLLDLMMPKKDGVSVLESMRAEPRSCNVPVILLTGVVEGSLIERARKLGVTAELAKARFTFDEMLVRIRECIGEE